jgi:hypothetical protein
VRPQMQRSKMMLARDADSIPMNIALLGVGHRYGRCGSTCLRRDVSPVKSSAA